MFIDKLCPEDHLVLRRQRKRVANRLWMRRDREARKLLCSGVDLPLEAGTCGRWVHAGAERCLPCARRRRWLLDHALNAAEIATVAPLEGDRDDQGERAGDTVGDVPHAVPLLDDDLSDLVA